MWRRLRASVPSFFLLLLTNWTCRNWTWLTLAYCTGDQIFDLCFGFACTLIMVLEHHELLAVAIGQTRGDQHMGNHVATYDDGNGSLSNSVRPIPEDWKINDTMRPGFCIWSPRLLSAFWPFPAFSGWFYAGDWVICVPGHTEEFHAGASHRCQECRFSIFAWTFFNPAAKWMGWTWLDTTKFNILYLHNIHI